MSKGLQALALLCVLAGCQGTSQVFDNPVVGPPPPRINAAEITVAGQEPEASRLELTDFNPEAAGPVTGLPGEIAARVNGTPIFVSDVLAPYEAQLLAFRPKVSAEEFEQIQRGLVQRDLPFHIDTAAVIDAVHAQMTAEQKESVNKQLDTFFDEEIARLMREANATSIADLEAKLAASGTSLANAMQVTGRTLPEVRKAFGDRALSSKFLNDALGAIPEATRKEMLAEYQSRIKDYSQPEQVKWQQLQISFGTHNGQDNARRALARARQDIQAGVPFADVVKKHGDGPLAALGGTWDWTQPDGVADPLLKEALSTVKVGDVSSPIEGDQAYVLVKITERQVARTTPFDEVQKELRTAIAARKKKERVSQVLSEIKSKAVVETMFDGETPADDRQDSPVRADQTGAL